jgi:hypothetical protein
MIVRPVPLEPAFEIYLATCRYAEATAAYMVRLEEIVGSLKTLTTGSHGFDYLVSVSQTDLLRIQALLSELTFDTDTEFGVTIRTRAVAQDPTNEE